MRGELHKTFLPTSSDLKKIPITEFAPNDVRQVINHIDEAWDQYERSNLMRKSINIYEQRDQEERGKILGKRGPSGMLIDRLGIWGYDSAGVSARPGPVGFESLRLMVETIPIFAACMLTRIRQVQTFCKPVEREAEVGYQIVRRYAQRKYSRDGDGDLEWRRWAARFFVNGGDVFNAIGRRKLDRPTLHTLVAKTVRDTYQYDALAIETELGTKGNLDGQPVGLYPLDGATIRLVTKRDETVNDNSISVDHPFAVQVRDAIPVAAFGYEHLIYEPRNPRTDVRLAGYGYPETEMLVKAATGWLNSMTLNIRGQDENRIPPGLLLLFGDYAQDTVETFRGEWNTLAAGVNRRWRLPVLAAKNKSEAGAEFVKFGMEFNEMYFARWMTFLTALVCAVLGMDPTEVNFESFTVNKSSLGGNDTAEKLASSKDKGLEPLLAYIQHLFTDYVVARWDDDYEFVFRGLHPVLMTERREAMALCGTVNEYRELEGLDPIPEEVGWGDLPMNSVLSQYAAPTIEALQPPQPQMAPGSPEEQQMMAMNPGSVQNGGMKDEDIAGMRGGSSDLAAAGKGPAQAQGDKPGGQPPPQQQRQAFQKSVLPRYAKALIEVVR